MYKRFEGAEELTAVFVGISGPGYASLANAYLSAALSAERRINADLRIANIDTTTAQDAWWIAYRILELEHKPDFILIPCYCWNMQHVGAIAEILSTELPDSVLILGGPEVSPIPQETLEQIPFAKFVISGEGEKSVPALIYSLWRGGDPSTLPGVSMRAEGQIRLGPTPEVIENPDSIPRPYFEQNPPATDGSAYIESFRGCPHSCAYCFEGKGISKIRSFSKERIAKEIATIANTPGMKSFSFIDSVFNLTRSRLEMMVELLEPYAKQGIRLHTIEVDMERIDDEEAALLARAGVASVETGPQTTCPVALELSQRSFNPEKYLRGLEACKRHNIRVDADFIIGLPGDTHSSVIKSFEFAVKADPEVIQSSTLHVLPGTTLMQRAEELGLNFEAAAPHQIISTKTLSYSEIRRLEVFGLALGKLHRARRRDAGR